jgi:hypothetical protein
MLIIGLLSVEAEAEGRGHLPVLVETILPLDATTAEEAA